MQFPLTKPNDTLYNTSLIKQISSSNKAAVAALAMLASIQIGRGAVVISGNIAGGTGQLEVTEDITLTISTAINAGWAVNLVFDEWVTNDGASTNADIADSIPLTINGGAVSNTLILNFTDNNTNLNSVTPNDGILAFQASSGLNPGDVLVIKAFAVEIGAIGGFNPDATGSFNGNVFLANDAAIIVSDIVAVPEPSSTALLGLGGLALMLRRRR